jgi:D-threo-aldose 1-dehydrogenase
METRTIPRTGLTVSAIGFGGAPLGDLYERLDDEIAIASVTRAHRAGITLFDTSPLYGHGLSEHRFGTALRRPPRESFSLSTKIGRVVDPRRPRAEGLRSRYVGGFPHLARFDYSYDGALRSLEQSLLRLGLDRVDILLIHDVDRWTHGEAVDARFGEAMDGAYRALDRLRTEHVVNAIGIGVNEAEMCERFARAGDFDVMMLAGRYTLLEQGALECFLTLAVEKRIGVLFAGVFNSGILATGPVPGARYNYRPAPPEIIERARRIEAVCRGHQVPLAHAALRFPLAHPAAISVVLGAVTPAEVDRNVAGLDAAIPSGLWRDLKAERLLVAHAPTPS